MECFSVFQLFIFVNPNNSLLTGVRWLCPALLQVAAGS